MRNAIAATPATDPTTAPAMTPPEVPFLCEVEVGVADASAADPELDEVELARAIPEDDWGVVVALALLLLLVLEVDARDGVSITVR